MMFLGIFHLRWFIYLSIIYFCWYSHETFIYFYIRKHDSTRSHNTCILLPVVGCSTSFFYVWGRCSLQTGIAHCPRSDVGILKQIPLRVICEWP